MVIQRRNAPERSLAVLLFLDVMLGNVIFSREEDVASVCLEFCEGKIIVRFSDAESG